MTWATACATILAKRAGSKDGGSGAELLGGGGSSVVEGTDVEGVVMAATCAVKEAIWAAIAAF